MGKKRGLTTAALLVGGVGWILGLFWITRGGLTAPFVATHPVGTAMVVLGGPVTLLACLLTGISRPREAGALLWLGGSVAALGLAMKSGADLWVYFEGMALLVLPQLVAGGLFLRAGRGASGGPSKRGAGGA